MNTKTLPLFTSSLNSRAWAIRRSLASLNRCRVMEISWRECLRRASDILRTAAKMEALAAADAAHEAEMVARAAAIAEKYGHLADFYTPGRPGWNDLARYYPRAA